MARITIDAVLQSMLKRAAVNEMISASFVLRPETVVSPARNGQRVEQILSRATGKRTLKQLQVSVHPILGTFSITAPAGFVARVTSDPEIVSAIAQHSAEEMHIAPIEPPRPIRRKI